MVTNGVGRNLRGHYGVKTARFALSIDMISTSVADLPLTE